ncbi:hypothetical protein T459_23414 [Capsicum annuum]|uniref:Uncharacterized protein n=1 Tax=Capsicum annuum TaxID=4072 RepID=A0A2G2YSB5_CAPAN|nr:putative stress-related protein-like [Capsicum annuum]PHT72629.1 hypothetical protein T459_23414 [Capsicum annuum]
MYTRSDTHTEPTYTVGQGRGSDLWTGDCTVSKTLCSLKHTETEIIDNNLSALSLIHPISVVKAHSRSIKGLHLEKDLSLLSPLYQNGKDVKQGSKVLTLPPVSGVREKYLDTDMKDASDYNDVPGALMDEKNDVISPDVENGNLSLDNIALDSVDAEIEKVRPILRMLARSSVSAFDLSGSISKIFEEQRNFRELLKDFDPPVLALTRHQTSKNALDQGVIDFNTIEVSFDNFPYYLCENTKNILISSTYIHLKCNKFAKYTSDLPTVCPRILLLGPAGLEIYQEIVDSLMLPGGSIAKEVEPIKGSSKPERASVFAKFVAQMAALHLNKKTASSVEAEIIGGSILRSHAQPKQEASTASSKSYTFKKGLAQAGSVAIETK